MLRECVNGGTRRRAHSATFSQHGSMKSSLRTCLDRSMLGLVSEFQRMRWRMGPPNKPRMTESHVVAIEGSRGPRRWRYLIDIIVLLAVTFLLDAALSAFVQVPIDLEKGFVLDAVVKVLLVGVGCGLVLLRGERLADIGLKRPESWTRTLIIGVGLAAIVFVAMYLSERTGFRRDLSKFKPVEGNLELAVLSVFYALIGAGFYEEFTFRGFLMQGLAMLFGGSRGAWIGACLVQGALFGLAHT